MDKTLSDMTINEFDESLVRELDNAGFSPIPSRPENFGITSVEYAELKGCSRATARDYLDAAVASGQYEKMEMRCKVKNNRGARAVVYFRAGAFKV